MKARPFFIFIALLALIMSLVFLNSCRAADKGGQPGTGQETAGETGAQDVQNEVQDEGGTQGEGAPRESGEHAEEENTEAAGEGGAPGEASVPQEITAKIGEADSLFQQGLYAEAAKEYRNVQIAIEDSDLPPGIREEVLEGIDENYNAARDITDTARMHHSNAMNLIYEKRYQEAEAELRAALEIYPKYQPAVDALDSLEDTKGLQ